MNDKRLHSFEFHKQRAHNAVEMLKARYFINEHEINPDLSPKHQRLIDEVKWRLVLVAFGDFEGAIEGLDVNQLDREFSKYEGLSNGIIFTNYLKDCKDFYDKLNATEQPVP